MKGWVLDNEEKDCFKYIMQFFTIKKLDCWDMKIPDWFENHEPCKELLKIGKE